jgi:hypothetical protein
MESLTPRFRRCFRIYAVNQNGSEIGKLLRTRRIECTRLNCQMQLHHSQMEERGRETEIYPILLFQRFCDCARQRKEILKNLWTGFESNRAEGQRAFIQTKQFES